MSTPDPITLSILKNRLSEIISTMERLLFHSGYSTVLRESGDGSAGITDATGASSVSSGMPHHLPPYYHTVRGVLARNDVSEMREGDCFIINDPYVGGTLHVPDVAIVTPVFYQGEHLGFCVSIVHEPDLGGIVPGSSGAMAREIFHDGLLLPGVRYWTSNGVERGIEAIIKQNSRTPELVAGDLRAMVGCTLVGAQKLGALCDEYGVETVKHCLAELQNASERRMRAALRALPDGEERVSTRLDAASLGLDQTVEINLRVKKEGENITFDLTGTSGQIPLPINIRPQVAEASTMLALIGFTDPTIPLNQGVRRAMTLINPEGSVTNPVWPAAVNNYAGMMGIVFELALKALAPFNRERAPASSGLGLGAITIGYAGTEDEKPKVQYELLVNSLGGTPTHDGVFVLSALGHATPEAPIEIMETEFPVLVEGHRLVPDSGGPGFFRGGLGYEKRYTVKQDAMFTVRFSPNIIDEHGVAAGWGISGGVAPPLGRIAVRGVDGVERAVAAMSSVPVKAGETVIVHKPGGGGWGDPRERDPAQVTEDVLNGFVTAEGARRDYGVTIGAVDAAA